jgi:hypothetical protein
MALRPDMSGHAAASMQRGSLRQVLAAVLIAGMVIVVMVPLLLGIAIQQGAIAPPQLDVRLGGLELIAYPTHAPDCDRYVTPCQPELMAAPAQEFYVIWVFSRTGQLASADEWQTGTRLLTLRLRNQFNGSHDVLTR